MIPIRRISGLMEKCDIGIVCVRGHRSEAEKIISKTFQHKRLRQQLRAEIKAAVQANEVSA
jgi:hypothetical protein